MVYKPPHVLKNLGNSVWWWFHHVWKDPLIHLCKTGLRKSCTRKTETVYMCDNFAHNFFHLLFQDFVNKSKISLEFGIFCTNMFFFKDIFLEVLFVLYFKPYFTFELQIQNWVLQKIQDLTGSGSNLLDRCRFLHTFLVLYLQSRKIYAKII